MDLYETDKEIVAKLCIPGFDLNNIDISVEGRVLRVSGKTEKQNTEIEFRYLRREIQMNCFEREVNLPSDVKTDEIQATYSKGVIKIVMPKVETKSTSKIKVKVEET